MSSSGSTGERSSSSGSTGERSSSSSSSGSTGERSSSSSSPVVAVRSLDSRSFWKAGELEDARVHPKFLFLHSNATSHKWAFGAIAELFDNAVDEINNGASFVKVDRIYNKRDNSPALLFQDDGGGMSPDSLRKCMSLGYSMKKANTTIGQYGNGFKTSTMRLGADVIVFSRSSLTSQATQSVGLLSYTFLHKTGQEDVIVPMVDFDVSNHWAEPIIYESQDDWSSNLKMILEWSPFASKDELLQQFEDIGSHGTKIIIYNLWLNDEGVVELSFDDDDEDIRLRDEFSRVALTKASKKAIETQVHISYQIRFSLRAYASMLYLRKFENFKIILRGKPVEQYNIADELRHPKVVTYRPRVSTALKEPTVETTLGFVKEFPAILISGFNVYHKNRLIRPFWKVIGDGNSCGIGVVGVLEANFIEPAHDKQDFERSSLYHRLEMGLKQMQLEYWRGHCGLVGHRPLDKKTSARTLQKDISVSPPVELNRNVQQNFLSENAIGLSANAHSSRAEAMLPAPIGQEDPRKVRQVFRDRKKLALIDDSDFVDVHLSPFVASQLLFNKRWKTTFYAHYREVMESKTIDQLVEAVNRLEELLEGDRRSAYCISGRIAISLVETLKKYECDKMILSPLITIISYARFNVCGAEMEEHVVPVLVNLVSDLYTGISNLALIALTRLLHAFPKRMTILVDRGALVAVHKEVKDVRGGYDQIISLASFLAAVCRAYSLTSHSVPLEKVELVLSILVDLFKNEKFSFLDIHIARACYALSYISYGRCLDIQVDAWNLIAQKLIMFISLADTSVSDSAIKVVGSIARGKNIGQMIAGSALGVVGNIARWGTLNQIQSLIKDHQLMICLRSLLRSEFKKFRKEACQIISNIAVQSETLMKDIIEEELIELLCHMLEKDEPDMKMEAVWTIYVVICGYR